MLGVPGREDFSGRSFLENPLERLVAAAEGIRRIANPIVVHVKRERGRRRIHRELPRLTAHLGEVQAGPAELARDGHAEVTRRLQLVEIFLEEPVFLVVPGSAFPAPGKKLIG